jgi:hypothetical protein
VESSFARAATAPAGPGSPTGAGGHAETTAAARRLRMVAGHDVRGADLVDRMVGIGKQTLAAAHTGPGDFAFTLTGTPEPGGGWRLAPRGTSIRYGAIAALGLLRLAEPEQRAILAGGTAYGLIGRLADQLDGVTGRGEIALLCWAAAEARHDLLPHVLARLSDVDKLPGPVDVVAAAWVLSALVAARPHADVEEHLAAARDRLLAARGPSLYPHVLGGITAWYRSHVGSFADQVYPVQALARLHASGADPEALAAAESVAGTICAAQGKAGQWWWHYDARSGSVVEDYPVYSVHQHAMTPMALFDLADAGGQPFTENVCRGLLWLARPAEGREDMVLGQPPVIWRKVARREPRKLVRGLRAGTTRVHPGLRLPVLDQVFRPGIVDHECRPYELGWLLFAWLAARHG